jgi:signal peptidase I
MPDPVPHPAPVGGAPLAPLSALPAEAVRVGKGTPSAEEAAAEEQRDGWRETAESIAIAFVLAFLFRTFEAEAFVIPTGSMAPTLYGRHKEVTCAACGYRYAMGSSDELDDNGTYLEPGNFVTAGTCHNCRHETTVWDFAQPEEAAPVFKGDRILVTKFPYELGEPRRWDVVVFRYPEQPKTNYIKRLVGLPGETLKILQGDVYARKGPDEPWEILRKDDPRKQREVRVLVHDDAHPEQGLVDAGWPDRWAGMRRGPGAGEIAGWTDDASGWRRDAATREFRVASDPSALRWLRYRNYVPEEQDWRKLAEAQAAGDGTVPADLFARLPDFAVRDRLRLVADFCGYNAFFGGRRGNEVDPGTFWVGDLLVSFRVTLGEAAPEARFVLELVEGNRRYRARFDPATGRVAVTRSEDGSRDPDDEVELASADTKVRAGGTYDVQFANVDDQLRLWIDGRHIDFEGRARYSPLGGHGRPQVPTDEDLLPVGIAAKGLSAVVSRLLLERDVYYRMDARIPNGHYFENPAGLYVGNLHSLLRFPAQWFREYDSHLSSALRPAAADGAGPDDVPEGRAGNPLEFPLGPDEFFMLGDNSPKSQDSRLWENGRGAVHRHAVPRTALIGKAFFIYWPHGVPFLNDGMGWPSGGESWYDLPIVRNFVFHETGPGRVYRPLYPSCRIPFYPQVGRMRRIR